MPSSVMTDITASFTHQPFVILYDLGEKAVDCGKDHGVVTDST